MILKCRSLVSQLTGIFPHICLQFAFGTATGFNIILIAELHKKDSEIPTSLDQLSWFASFDIFVPVGTTITGLLLHRLGSRLMALISALTYVASWLTFNYSSTASMIFAGRVLHLMVALYPVSIPYISEISEPRFRSSFLAITKLAINAGTFFSLLLGSLMYWRTVAMVNLAFPILAAATVLATPNSPTWLASKERLVEAEKALCWLRGWVEPAQVQTELCALVDGVQTSKSPPEDIESTTARASSYRAFLQRSFYLPLGTMCLINLLYYMSGANVIEAYSTVIFRELDSPIEESVATAIFGAMGVVGNVIVLLVIRRTGKRKLVFTSIVAIAFCTTLVAVVGFLGLKGEYAWIPPIAVIVANFAKASGVGAVLYMIVGEIFPANTRYIGTAIVSSVRMVVRSLVNKGFLYAADAVTMSGVFLFFAVVNLVFLGTLFFLLPETEGKSLREIEDHYKGVKKTKTSKV